MFVLRGGILRLLLHIPPGGDSREVSPAREREKEKERTRKKEDTGYRAGAVISRLPFSRMESPQACGGFGEFGISHNSTFDSTTGRIRTLPKTDSVWRTPPPRGIVRLRKVAKMDNIPPILMLSCNAKRREFSDGDDVY